MREADIEKYFAPEDITKKNPVSKETKGKEDEEDAKEWFIDDGPIEEDVRTVFVRPGKKSDEIVSRAS